MCHHLHLLSLLLSLLASLLLSHLLLQESRQINLQEFPRDYHPVSHLSNPQAILLVHRLEIPLVSPLLAHLVNHQPSLL